MLVDPDGKNEEPIPSGPGKYEPSQAWFSPDGSMLAVIGMDYDTQTKNNSSPALPGARPTTRTPVTELGVECRAVV